MREKTITELEEALEKHCLRDLKEAFEKHCLNEHPNNNVFVQSFKCSPTPEGKLNVSVTKIAPRDVSHSYTIAELAILNELRELNKKEPIPSSVDYVFRCNADVIQNADGSFTFENYNQELITKVS